MKKLKEVTMKNQSNSILDINTIDLTGKRFSKLLVLGVDSKKQVIHANGKKKNIYYWKCRCDCGREVIKSGDSLRRGHTQSCGCSRIKSHKGKEIENLTGKRYSKLLVLELVGKKVKVYKNSRGTETYWKCRCDCGKEVIRTARGLKSGATKSCGCNKDYKKLIEYNKKTIFKEGTNLALLNKAINKNSITKVRGVVFSKEKNKYVAAIGFKGKVYNLGSYTNVEDAINARKEAEKKYYKPILEKYNYKKCKKAIEDEEEFE